MKKVNTMSDTKKAVILLSGGLDSLVSLADAFSQGIDVKLALTFNYGQKAFSNEFQASKKICEYYKIEHKVIQLDWLKDITNTSLVANSAVPQFREEDLKDDALTKQSMKNVWVPNRNGLFVNIAASFCDSLEYNFIILGANYEEAQTFSDNSKEFVTSIDKAFETSTNCDIKLYVPLISMSKKQIVERATELDVPLFLLSSCYENGYKHCGVCESCTRLKRALKDAGRQDLVEEIFG